VNEEYKFSTVYLFAPTHFDSFAAGALLALFRPFLGWTWQEFSWRSRSV